MVFQILGNTCRTHVGVYILIEDRPNGRCFLLIDFQLAINQTVAVRCKAAVPAAFPCFLDSAFHGLDTNVLPLDLCNRRQHRDHQLARVFGGVDAVFYADQVHAKILHHLQGGQHIRSIAAKPGELEHQHIGNTILAGFDVVHHFAERSTAFNGFARFSGILIFTDDLVVIEVCIGFHAGFLRIQ